MTTTILWFRNDLRLDDNSALAAAIEAGGDVIPVFIWSPEEDAGWPPGGASKWWLHQALLSLESRLAKHGSQLIVRHGNSLKILRQLVEETGATQVVWNRRYEGPLRAVDMEVKRSLR
ncbi:MAG TPA: deoxyribodipyrimidine photolyase, partial [Opitutae bacterium]|nr:deoxyribodipyrimidine photolyase [Opitutae bacterium]